jgi:dihydroorotase
VTAYIKYKAEEVGAVRVYPIGAITKGLQGTELAPAESLKAAGAVALSDDGNPVKSASMMRKALTYASMFGIPVISHCEDTTLSEDGAMNAGKTATILGLKGIPNSSEELMVSREALLAEETGKPVHIAHVSTAGSIRILRDAKARGVHITCETCPHYFSLTEEECIGFNTFAKVAPPLRSAKDVTAVIEGLKDGTIDAIATDHAPHHEDEKNIEFADAAKGLIGFETALSVAYTYLVLPGHLTVERLLSLMGRSPASILKIPGGFLKEGEAADLAVFDPKASWVLSREQIVSKSKNSPYIGKTLSGKVTDTMVAGRFVFRNGKVTV